MKLIKLTETHYIIVNDSEIKDGDWMIRDGEQPTLVTPNFWWDFGVPYKKITHSTQPLEDYTRGDGKTIKVYVEIEQLHLYKIKELIGEVDVEKKILKLLPDDSQWQDRILASKIYNQALEDNKEKKYTEEDVIRIVEKSRETGLTAEYLMMTFQPQTEWEVEIVDGKLKLK